MRILNIAFGFVWLDFVYGLSIGGRLLPCGLWIVLDGRWTKISKMKFVPTEEGAVPQKLVPKPPLCHENLVPFSSYTALMDFKEV